MISGRHDIEEAAIISFQCTWFCVFKDTIPTVSVFNASFEIKTEEYIYSFHPLINTKIATAAIPGTTSGRMIFQKIVKLFAPSTRAASYHPDIPAIL